VKQRLAYVPLMQNVRHSVSFGSIVSLKLHKSLKTEFKMLNKEQANAAADAILAPVRDAQVAARKISEKRRDKIASQQYIAGFGLAGFVICGIVGYVIFDDIVPSCIVGSSVGAILGRFTQHRAA
jgi:hypothetical protein